MLFPNFDPYAFSRMSPRERMLQQLRGGGMGAFGIANVLYTNGGQVSALAGTTRLGLFSGLGAGRSAPSQYSFSEPLPIQRSEFDTSAQNQYLPQAVAASSLCAGVACPPGQHCDAGACIPSQAVMDTTPQASATFAPVAARPTAAVQLTTPPISIPQGAGLGPGAAIGPDDVMGPTGPAGPTSTGPSAYHPSGPATVRWGTPPLENPVTVAIDDGAPNAAPTNNTPDSYAAGTPVNPEDVHAYGPGYDVTPSDMGSGGGGGTAPGTTAPNSPQEAAAAAALQAEQAPVPWGWIVGGIAAAGFFFMLGKKR